MSTPHEVDCVGTVNSCTCLSFSWTHSACKHMYIIAQRLHFNIKESVTVEVTTCHHRHPQNLPKEWIEALPTQQMSVDKSLNVASDPSNCLYAYLGLCEPNSRGGGGSAATGQFKNISGLLKNPPVWDTPVRIDNELWSNGAHTSPLRTPMDPGDLSVTEVARIWNSTVILLTHLSQRVSTISNETHLAAAVAVGQGEPAQLDQDASVGKEATEVIITLSLPSRFGRPFPCELLLRRSSHNPALRSVNNCLERDLGMTQVHHKPCL